MLKSFQLIGFTNVNVISPFLILNEDKSYGLTQPSVKETFIELSLSKDVDEKLILVTLFNESELKLIQSTYDDPFKFLSTIFEKLSLS